MPGLPGLLDPWAIAGPGRLGSQVVCHATGGQALEPGQKLKDVIIAPFMRLSLHVAW